MTAQTYNGWTNWETWNVALWVQNDEYLYKEARRYRHLGYNAFASMMMEFDDNNATPDGAKWDDPKLDIDELNEMIEEL